MFSFFFKKNIKPNKKEFEYKTFNKLNDRKKSSSNKLIEYPDNLPIIIENGNDKSNYSINKNILILNKELTIEQLIFFVRKDANVVNNNTNIYIYISNNNKLKVPKCNTTINYNYSKYKDVDGFLYIYYVIA